MIAVQRCKSPPRHHLLLLLLQLQLLHLPGHSHATFFRSHHRQRADPRGSEAVRCLLRFYPFWLQGSANKSIHWHQPCHLKGSKPVYPKASCQASTFCRLSRPLPASLRCPATVHSQPAYLPACLHIIFKPAAHLAASNALINLTSRHTVVSKLTDPRMR